LTEHIQGMAVSLSWVQGCFSQRTCWRFIPNSAWT